MEQMTIMLSWNHDEETFSSRSLDWIFKRAFRCNRIKYYWAHQEQEDGIYYWSKFVFERIRSKVRRRWNSEFVKKWRKKVKLLRKKAESCLKSIYEWILIYKIDYETIIQIGVMELQSLGLLLRLHCLYSIINFLTFLESQSPKIMYWIKLKQT